MDVMLLSILGVCALGIVAIANRMWRLLEALKEMQVVVDQIYREIRGGDGEVRGPRV